MLFFALIAYWNPEADERPGSAFEGFWPSEYTISVKPLFNQYSKTHKITIHQGNNSR